MKTLPLAILAAVALSACAASLPPNNPKEHSTTVQCARSAPIMGWGGGTVWSASLDDTKEGGTFEMIGECGGFKTTQNQKLPAVKAASAP